jgi:outer membrane protein OmpA-like peptidoglycan-associated protein
MKKVLGLVVIWAVVLGGAGFAWKMLFERPDPGVPPLGTNVPIVPPPGTKVRLALDSFSGYCVFRTPAFKKKVAERGLDFEWVDDKADYKARMGTVKDGSTPFAVFTIDALLQQTPHDGEPPASIILIIDETRGADAMVAYPQGVKDIDALNDPKARIVLAEGTPSEMLARVVRSQFDLPRLPTSRKDYLIPAKDADDVLQRFLKAAPTEKTAYVLWEPYVQKARQAGASVLVDSGEFQGYIVDVLTVQTAYLKEHPDRVEAVVQSYLEVLHDARQSTDGMTDLVEADADIIQEKMSREDARQVANGIWWKNTLDNYAHFHLLSARDAHGLQPVVDMVKNITRLLDQTRQPGEPTPGVARPDKLARADVLRKLYEQRPGFMIGKETVSAEETLEPLTDEGWNALHEIGSVKLPIIEFSSTKKFELTDDGKEKLAEVPEKLTRWPRAYLLIEGQTLAGGDPESNKDLREKRANAVLRYLVDELKVPAFRLRAVAGDKEGEGRSVRLVAKRR